MCLYYSVSLKGGTRIQSQTLKIEKDIINWYQLGKDIKL